LEKPLVVRAWASFGGIREITSSVERAARVLFIKIYYTIFFDLGLGPLKTGRPLKT